MPEFMYREFKKRLECVDGVRDWPFAYEYLNSFIINPFRRKPNIEHHFKQEYVMKIKKELMSELRPSAKKKFCADFLGNIFPYDNGTFWLYGIRDLDKRQQVESAFRKSRKIVSAAVKLLEEDDDSSKAVYASWFGTPNIKGSDRPRLLSNFKRMQNRMNQDAMALTYVPGEFFGYSLAKETLAGSLFVAVYLSDTFFNPGGGAKFNSLNPAEKTKYAQYVQRGTIIHELSHILFEPPTDDFNIHEIVKIPPGVGKAFGTKNPRKEVPLSDLISFAYNPQCYGYYNCRFLAKHRRSDWYWAWRKTKIASSNGC